MQRGHVRGAVEPIGQRAGEQGARLEPGQRGQFGVHRRLVAPQRRGQFFRHGFLEVGVGGDFHRHPVGQHQVPHPRRGQAGSVRGRARSGETRQTAFLEGGHQRLLQSLAKLGARHGLGARQGQADELARRHAAARGVVLGDLAGFGLEIEVVHHDHLLAGRGRAGRRPRGRPCGGRRHGSHRLFQVRAAEDLRRQAGSQAERTGDGSDAVHGAVQTVPSRLTFSPS